jgi:hypothetical protein
MTRLPIRLPVVTALLLAFASVAASCTPPVATAVKTVTRSAADDDAKSEYGNTGQGAVVAVFDNGANYAHTDLREHMWRNPREIPNNGIDDDHNGYVDDVYGYDVGSMSANVRDTSSGRQHGTMTFGIAALMLSERPAMTVWRLREILEQTAHDLGAPGKDIMFGYGRVDAYAAVTITRA